MERMNTYTILVRKPGGATSLENRIAIRKRCDTEFLMTVNVNARVLSSVQPRTIRSNLQHRKYKGNSFLEEVGAFYQLYDVTSQTTMMLIIRHFREIVFKTVRQMELTQVCIQCRILC